MYPQMPGLQVPCPVAHHMLCLKQCHIPCTAAAKQYCCEASGSGQDTHGATYHDEDLLRTRADPLLGLLRLVWVRHTKSDGMNFAVLSTAALVDGIQGLLLTAPQLDGTALSALGNGHQQLWQACWAGGGAHGHHSLEADVVAGHQLARKQWL